MRPSTTHSMQTFHRPNQPHHIAAELHIIRHTQLCFPAAEHPRPLTGAKLYFLVTETKWCKLKTTCPGSSRDCVTAESRTRESTSLMRPALNYSTPDNRQRCQQYQILYPRSFTSSSRTAITDYCLDRFFWATRFLILYYSLSFFVSGPCARVSWLSRQLFSAY